MRRSLREITHEFRGFADAQTEINEGVGIGNHRGAEINEGVGVGNKGGAIGNVADGSPIIDYGSPVVADDDSMLADDDSVLAAANSVSDFGLRPSADAKPTLHHNFFRFAGGKSTALNAFAVASKSVRVKGYPQGKRTANRAGTRPYGSRSIGVRLP